MLRLAQAVFGGPPQFIGGFGHQVRWATKKAAGSTKNGGTSPGQRLGLKKSGGQSVFVGQIIARQTGTKWRKGDGVGVGRDNTLFAMRDGVLRFRFHPNIKKTWAFVEPFEAKLPKAAQRRYKYDGLKKEAKQARADNYSKRLALLAEIDAFNAKKLGKDAAAASA